MNELREVHCGEPIKASEWNAIVERVNQTTKPKLSFKVPTNGKTGLRPASITDAWTKNDKNVWKSTARFIDPTTGEVDMSMTVDVYAPVAASSFAPPTGRAWVVWRGRWEVVAQPSSGETYQAGEGIAIYSGTPKTIENAGLVSACVTHENYVDTGALTFDGQVFKWDTSLVETVGKRGLTLRQPTIAVNIQNDNVITIGFSWGI